MDLSHLFPQVFAAIADGANGGSNATGDIAETLINLGTNFAAISQLLNGVATSADATPAMVAYAQAEMRALQDRLAYEQSQPKTNWLAWGVAGVLAVALLRSSSGGDRTRNPARGRRRRRNCFA